MFRGGPALSKPLFYSVLKTPSAILDTARPPAPDAAASGEPHRRALLALTSLGAFMAPFNGSSVAVALPAIGSGLKLGYGTSMWIQAAYLLSMAIFLIPLGRMADRHGRVRGFLAGVAVFVAGAIASALSPGGGALVASRILQGIGGALLSATSAAIVTAAFPPGERGRALGINVMAVYMGLSVGPPLGGWLVGRFGWPAVFWINVPVGALALAWGAVVQRRRTETPSRSLQPDLGGALGLAVVLVSLLVPLSFAPEWGWTSWKVRGPLAGAAAAFAVLLAVERRVRDPLLDPALVRHNRLFAAANLAALLNYCALYAVSLLTAIHLQLVQGRSAQATGLILLIQPLMQAGLSPFAGRWSDRIGSRLLSTAGMLATASGMAWLAALSRTPALPLLAGALALVGLGMALFSAPNTSAIMGSVERARLGQASAFLGTMRVMGQALSVALLGGIAAYPLGPGGWRLLLQRAGSDTAAAAFDRGYGLAMWTGVALALVGAGVSMVRGPHGPGVKR